MYHTASEARAHGNAVRHAANAMNVNMLLAIIHTPLLIWGAAPGEGAVQLYPKIGRCTLRSGPKGLGSGVQASASWGPSCSIFVAETASKNHDAEQRLNATLYQFKAFELNHLVGIPIYFDFE